MNNQDNKQPVQGKSLLSRISLSTKQIENQEKSKSPSQTRTLIARLSNLQPNLLSRISHLEFQKQISEEEYGLSPSSATIAAEGKLELKHTQPYLENSKMNQDFLHKKRKLHSNYTAQRSTRPRLELRINLQQQEYEQRQEPTLIQTQLAKPLLLSRLAPSDANLDDPSMDLSPSPKERIPKRNLDLMRPTCPGTRKKIMRRLEPIPVASKPLNSFGSTTKISKEQSSMSVLHQELQKTSHLPSGNISSRENQSTLTKSSLLSTGLELMRSGSVRGHSVPPSANFRFTPASLLNWINLQFDFWHLPILFPQWSLFRRSS